jgi:hypothetical protein
MFDAATEPVAAIQPDPNRAEPHRPVPPCIGQILSLVHALVTYGKNLADTLQQHGAALRLLPFFESIAITFGTSNPSSILARITRGLLRAAALEARLRRRAASGRDIKPTEVPLPFPRQPRAAKPATLPGEPAQDRSFARPPTTEEIIAKDRLRPIGAVLVEICLDLGIAPGQMMDRVTAEQLRTAIAVYGGSLVRLLDDKRRCADPTEDSSPFAPIPITEATPPAEAGPPSVMAGPVPAISTRHGPTAVFPPWPTRSPQSPTPAGTGPP